MGILYDRKETNNEIIVSLKPFLIFSIFAFSALFILNLLCLIICLLSGYVFEFVRIINIASIALFCIIALISGDWRISDEIYKARRQKNIKATGRYFSFSNLKTFSIPKVKKQFK